MHFSKTQFSVTISVLVLFQASQSTKLSLRAPQENVAVMFRNLRLNRRSPKSRSPSSQFVSTVGRSVGRSGVDAANAILNKAPTIDTIMLPSTPQRYLVICPPRPLAIKSGITAPHISWPRESGREGARGNLRELEGGREPGRLL